MSVKIWNYDNPVNYIYDVDKIEISEGLVRLIQRCSISDVYAGWHLNELSGINCEDFSGNGRNGTLINSPTWVAGKLNNCILLNGTNQSINCGNIMDFERTDAFSLEAWIKTTKTGEDILTRYSGGKGIISYVATGGKIYISLRNTSGANEASRYSLYSIIDNNWHHIIITYDGSSSNTGIKIYIDGLDNTDIESGINNLTSTIKTVSNLYIGGRTNNGNFSGYVDEAVIYNKELTSNDVSFRYNSGVGREEYHLTFYANDKPFIQPVTLFHADYMASFNHFLETLGAGNQGQIKYILSGDGSIWRYWDGTNWATGGNENNNNTQTEIETHLADFPLEDNITFRAYLISDGTQKVILDNNTLDYLSNQYPYVYAGEDKACLDNITIAPFSDAITYDPDGDIELGQAFYNIEGSGWIEISKGALTLQEAIRSFVYAFDNPGEITCQLKVVDQLGSSTTDTLIVTVSKYTVTFNIIDESGFDLPALVCNFGDGLGWQLKYSPFTYAFDYGTYNVTIEKFGFKPFDINLNPSEISEVNQVLQILAIGTEELAQAVQDILQSELDFLMLQNTKILGLSQANYKLENIIYNDNGNVISATVTTYATSEDCESETNPLAIYYISAIYNEDGKLIKYKSHRGG